MTPGEQRARRILREIGLRGDEALQLISGNWSNDVWIGSDHVLRVSRHDSSWLAHEVELAALLPSDVPYPKPLASGRHDGATWVLAPRIHGAPLYATWTETTSAAERSNLIASLTRALRALHRVELPTDLATPASRGGGPPVRPEDFPRSIRDFVSDVAGRRVVADEIAREIRTIVEEAVPLLPTGRRGTVHTDLTFANAMWDGSQVWLLDLEYACTAPIDYELAHLLRYCWNPTDAVPPDWAVAVRAADHGVIPHLVLEHYPELFDVSGLELRLMTYGLAGFARGWLLRPDLWTEPLVRRSSELLAEFVRGNGWTRLIPT